MIQRLRFAVDERPICVWLFDRRERSQEFLKRVDPDYFSYVAQVHAEQLETEHEQWAALSLRMACDHALEAFFALLAATVQAPECVYGWLAEYRNDELRSVVRKITSGAPLLSKLRMATVTWESLSDAIHRPLVLEDKEKEKRIKSGFGRMWRRFAVDFLDDTARVEYNSIKHGFRAKSGGFSLAMGPEDTPGVPCPPERMRSLGGSQFGSTFFVTERLKGSRHNLRTRRKARNWSAVSLGNGLLLIAMSLKNVLATLRSHSGEAVEGMKFHWPADLESFDTPWAEVPGVTEASFDHDIPEEGIPLCSKEEILSVYEELRARRDETEG